MNLPSRKKLIAVLSNPQIQMRILTVAICLLAAAPVFAQAGGDPWTRAVQVLQQSFTTTIAHGLALVAIVVGGLGGATLPWLVGFLSTRFGSLKAGLVVPLLGSLAMIALHSFSLHPSNSDTVGFD